MFNVTMWTAMWTFKLDLFLWFGRAPRYSMSFLSSLYEVLNFCPFHTSLF